MAEAPIINSSTLAAAPGSGNVVKFRTASGQAGPLSHIQMDQNLWLIAKQAAANFTARQGQYVDGDSIQDSSLEARHFMDDSIPQSAISAGASNALVPAGAIFPFAGTVWNEANTGFLLCDGRLLPQGDYPALFQAIDQTYGSSGVSFRLPDLQGRYLVGGTAGVVVSDTTRVEAPMGSEVVGASEVTLTRDQMPSHEHDFLSGRTHQSADNTKDKGNGFNRGVNKWQTDTLQRYDIGSDTLVGGADENGRALTPGSQHDNEFGGSFTGKAKGPGGDEAHDNAPPSIAINYLIKT